MTIEKEFSLIILNWLMYHLPSKKNIVLTKKIINRSAYRSKICEKILYKRIDHDYKIFSLSMWFGKNSQAQY